MGEQFEFSYRPSFEDELKKFYDAMEKAESTGGVRAHHLDQWEKPLLEALGSDSPDHETLKQAFDEAMAPRGDVTKVYDAIYKIQIKKRKVA